MEFTIDKISPAHKTLVLLHSPATFQECLIHAMDAYRNAEQGEKRPANLEYAKRKATMAKQLAAAQSRRHGAKQAIKEADHILRLCETLKQ